MQINTPRIHIPTYMLNISLNTRRETLRVPHTTPLTAHENKMAKDELDRLINTVKRRPSYVADGPASVHPASGQPEKEDMDMDTGALTLREAAEQVRKYKSERDKLKRTFDEVNADLIETRKELKQADKLREYIQTDSDERTQNAKKTIDRQEKEINTLEEEIKRLKKQLKPTPAKHGEHSKPEAMPSGNSAKTGEQTKKLEKDNQTLKQENIDLKKQLQTTKDNLQKQIKTNHDSNTMAELRMKNTLDEIKKEKAENSKLTEKLGKIQEEHITSTKQLREELQKSKEGIHHTAQYIVSTSFRQGDPGHKNVRNVCRSKLHDERSRFIFDYIIKLQDDKHKATSHEIAAGDQEQTNMSAVHEKISNELIAMKENTERGIEAASRETAERIASIVEGSKTRLHARTEEVTASLHTQYNQQLTDIMARIANCNAHRIHLQAAAGTQISS